MKKAPTVKKNEIEAGQGQIEFVISLFAVMLLMFCAWEALMAVYTSNVMGDAAKEGVRYAIVRGSTGSASCNDANTTGKCSADPFGVAAVVTNYARASLHDVSAITITVNYVDGTNDPPNRVKVTVTYTYVPYVNLPFFHPTLTTTAEGRIVF